MDIDLYHDETYHKCIRFPEGVQWYEYSPGLRYSEKELTLIKYTNPFANESWIALRQIKAIRDSCEVEILHTFSSYKEAVDSGFTNNPLFHFLYKIQTSDAVTDYLLNAEYGREDETTYFGVRWLKRIDVSKLKEPIEELPQIFLLKA